MRGRAAKLVAACVALAVLALHGSRASAAAVCPGDCGGDGRVTVDEIVAAVSIALGSPSSACPPSGAGAGGANPADLVAAIDAALAGCPPAAPTPTASATPTATPSATETQTSTPTAADTSTPTVTATITPTFVGPFFADVTLSAGLDYVQYHLPDPPPLEQPIYFSGGAAAGDYDRDGWVDLFVTRLDAPPILFRNREGFFEDVTTSAGLALDGMRSNGAGWADLDNDGDLDLYVTTLGVDQRRFYLFINDGLGHFTEEAEARGAAVMGAEAHFGFSVSFGDYDRDGWLDLHTTEWLFDDYLSNPAPSNNRLLHNRGAGAPGHFDDVTVEAGVAMDDVPPTEPRVRGTFGFSSTFADLDDDGWPDLAIAADFGTSRLFWNNRDGRTFTDGTVAAGVGLDENGMGSAIGDYDGDGRLDWFVTSIYDPDDYCTENGFDCFWGLTGNRLYRNDGDRQFSDRTDAAGVRNGHWGWGAAFFDYDHDGDLDLVMTNGAKFPFGSPEVYLSFPFRVDPMRLWRNDGDQFTEVATELGVRDVESGKGLLTFDYDNDGDLDLFVANNEGRPVLYRNEASRGGSWLRVAVSGRDSNRDGIGARVLVRVTPTSPVQVREIYAGSQFLGHSETAAHFGLGPGTAPIAEVRVIWPATGREQVLHDVPRDTKLEVTEPTT